MMEEDAAWRRHVRLTLETLRPEDYRPWDNPRPDGRRLDEAIYALVPDGVRTMVSRHLAMVDAGIEEPQRAREFRDWLWHVLRGELSHGRSQAKGIRVGGDLCDELIRATWFDDAEPDFPRNRLVCCGVTFSGIRVFVPPPQDGAPVIEALKAGRPSGMSLIMAELNARHARGERESGVGAEARLLSAWLLRNHPDASQAGASAVENAIREQFRALKPSLKK